MRRCQREIIPAVPGLPRRVRVCLRQTVDGARYCHRHGGPVDLVRQTLDPLGDYVEAEKERHRRQKALKS